jgi:hypothetical protein
VELNAALHILDHVGLNSFALGKLPATTEQETGSAPEPVCKQWQRYSCHSFKTDELIILHFDNKIKNKGSNSILFQNI